MIKVMTIAGTRPEIIRLSQVMARLDEVVDHVFVHTGQNWAYELGEIFFDQLGIRRPDHTLHVDVGSLGRTLGDTLVKTEEVLRRERPDAVLVLGDTNSAIAAVMARRMHVPVYHMEAGNRCFDPNVPEEINRRLVDHVADFNLVYTEHARRNLLAEGLPTRRILLTGSPMVEVIDAYRDQVEASPVLSDLGLRPRGYLLASAHREENVDDPDRLTRLLASLDRLQKVFDRPVLVSTHPRTRRRLAERGEGVPTTGIVFHEPFGLADYLRLQQQAWCVLSDSGTVSEESAILGFPAVTLRESIERPEALDAGSMVMCGVEPVAVERAVRLVTEQWARGEVAAPPAEYQIRNCSQRVVNFIVSTVDKHHAWAGIRRPGRFAGEAED
ncbi:MAG: non-hydrolyzing UDP-N-acetylglucosamine 2-epimerase [Actinomycetota bacterium]